MRGRPNLRRLQAQCDAFNEAHPVGASVRCWKGLKGDGPGAVGSVRGPGAFVLSGHTPVVFVDGVSGCIALTHVEGARDPQAASAPRSMAFADLATPEEVKLAAPWAKAVIRIEAGPCQGTFLAFECLEEATAWTDRQGARD